MIYICAQYFRELQNPTRSTGFIGIIESLPKYSQLHDVHCTTLANFIRYYKCTKSYLVISRLTSIFSLFIHIFHTFFYLILNFTTSMLHYKLVKLSRFI